MSSLPLWASVVTSATVGALAAALVQYAAQMQERRARRQELLLAKAVELAEYRTRLIVEQVERHGGLQEIPDHVVSTETYYRWLMFLLENGRLPADAQVASRAKPSLPGFPDFRRHS